MLILINANVIFQESMLVGHNKESPERVSGWSGVEDMGEGKGCWGEWTEANRDWQRTRSPQIKLRNKRWTQAEEPLVRETRREKLSKREEVVSSAKCYKEAK